MGERLIVQSGEGVGKEGHLPLFNLSQTRSPAPVDDMGEVTRPTCVSGSLSNSRHMSSHSCTFPWASRWSIPSGGAVLGFAEEGLLLLDSSAIPWLQSRHLPLARLHGTVWIEESDDAQLAVHVYAQLCR